MAGPTTTKKGANPAPDYTSMFNSIELLQSARARQALASSTTTLTQRRAAQQQQLPGTTTTNSKSAARTAALLAQAKAEEADLDRLAMDDDNAGVGLHSGAGSKTAEQLARLREDRKLAARLLGKKRRADEARGQRMRGEDHANSDDEPGRSGVGRAKKKVRRDVGDDEAQGKQTSGLDEVVDTDMKDGDGGVGKVERISAGSSKQDQQHLEGGKEADDDQDKATEAAAKGAVSTGDQPKATDGSNPENEAVSKKKRKKKNKKKPKAAAPQGDS